jgi:hypothetical protein
MNDKPAKLSFNKEFFLFLLPLFFVFHGYVQNFPSVSALDAIRLLGEYVLFTLALSSVFLFIFRSWRKAAVFTFIIISIQFFFGALQDFLKYLFGNWFAAKYSFMLPAIFILLVVIFLHIRKTKKQFTSLTKYLNIVLYILLFVEGATILFKVPPHAQSGQLDPKFNSCKTCAKPNIYLIIADEYAGSKALHDIFTFDNSDFENALYKRGFLTIRHSRSNYNYTPFSMASTLSMDYLKGISSKSNDINNRNICYQNINKNPLVHILKETGYNFVNLSPFDFADQPSQLTKNYFYSTHERIISSQTLTSRVYKDLSYHLITSFHFGWAQKKYLEGLINNIRFSYEGTIATASETSKKPQFVYTHFIMPHYPYLFDKNGNALKFEEAIQGGRKDLYLGYLQYGNKLCLSLIDSIFKKDPTNPVIILMSDHGFTKYSSEYEPAYNFLNMINIYVPGRNYAAFSDSLTNVNLFRTLLNTQFGQQLPLLKDSTFFLKEY